MAKRRTRVKMSVGKILALKPDELEKMSTAKLKAITTILNSAANKRVKRAQQLGTESSVIDDAIKGGKFVTPRSNKKMSDAEMRSMVESSFIRAKLFLEHQTSSTRGVKKKQTKVLKQFIKQAKKITKSKQQDIVPGPDQYAGVLTPEPVALPWYFNLNVEDKQDLNELVWKAVDKFAEKYATTKERRYLVANQAYEIVTKDKTNQITDKDDVFSLLEEWAKDEYEQSVQEFEDVGDEEIAAVFKDFTGI